MGRSPSLAIPGEKAPSYSLSEETSAYRKVTWRIVPFLMLCYVVAYLDRVNVGFAKLQMLNDLKFSETGYGLGAGVFFLSYFVFAPPSTRSAAWPASPAPT
jgi:sugar phosphate permease